MTPGWIQHAEDGIYQVSTTCTYLYSSNNSCKNKARFVVKGCVPAAYCTPHAGDSMVNVHAKRCWGYSSTAERTFNIAGSKARLHYKQHADGGMVHVRSRRCSHQ